MPQKSFEFISTLRVSMDLQYLCKNSNIIFFFCIDIANILPTCLIFISLLIPQDLDSVDSLLPDFFLNNLQNLFQCVAIIVVCVASTPYFIVVMVPLSYIFYKIQRFFAASSRELKRLEGTSRSPMYSVFSEVLMGLSTIRSFAKDEDFLSKHFSICDTNSKIFFLFWMSSRWLALRADVFSNLIILFVAVIAVVMKVICRVIC